MIPLGAPRQVAAERWFLERGVPVVLRPGALVRRLWSRSAPVFAAWAVMMVNSWLVVLATGKHTIDINGEPTRTEWFVLGLVVLVLPIAATVGWLVSRIQSTRRRMLASTFSVAIAVAGAVFGGPSPRVFVNLVVVGVGVSIVLALTASGVGSILGWAVRMTLDKLALTGTLFVRALPVVLLTVLVFFNTYVWLMAAIVSRARLWLALLFLALIAIAFLTSSTVDRVRPMLSASGQPTLEDEERLAGTPFRDIADPPGSDELSRGERWNVMFVLTVSQIVQVGMVAVATAAIFLALGLILLSPQLLAEWTQNSSGDGQLLGMTLPVPQSLIQVSMFLGAMTFMYISARAVGDADYRTRFLDQLIDDLRLTLVSPATGTVSSPSPSASRMPIAGQIQISTQLTPVIPVVNFTMVSSEEVCEPVTDVFGKRYGEGPTAIPRRPAEVDEAYRYCPRFDSVSIARLALDDFPVTRVRM